MRTAARRPPAAPCRSASQPPPVPPPPPRAREPPSEARADASAGLPGRVGGGARLQLAFKDLPRRVARQRLDEVDPARPLEVRERLAHVLGQLRLGGALARAK